MGSLLEAISHMELEYGKTGFKTVSNSTRTFHLAEKINFSLMPVKEY